VLSGKSIPTASVIRVDLVVDAAGASEAAVQFYQTVRRQIAQDIHFHF
jgi:hypothetical protein